MPFGEEILRHDAVIQLDIRASRRARVLNCRHLKPVSQIKAARHQSKNFAVEFVGYQVDRELESFRW